MRDLALGFFRGMSGSDSVLLACSAPGLIRLRRLLVSSLRFPVAIHDAAEVSRNYPTALYAATFPVEDGYTWPISSDTLPGIDEVLGNLANLGSGHEYFRLSSSSVRLMVSVNEYDSAWWWTNA